MAAVIDEYIKANMSGTIYKCERHNIVGKKDGDADEQEVYKRNELNGYLGSTIREKYTCPGCNRPDYNTKEQLKKFFTTSSKEAYDEAEEKAKYAAKKAKDEAEEKAKLRPEYDNEFKYWSPEERFGGNESEARRAGWMPFEEWFAKKKAGKPLYSKHEQRTLIVDALQRENHRRHRENHRSSVRQHVKKEAVTPPRGAGAAAAAPQKQPQRPKTAGKKKPLRLNFEPSDQKKAPPPQNPPPQNQQEWCVIA